MERLVKVWQVGKISYANGLKLQKQLANLHTRDKHLNDTLLCVEHPPVYTIGIRTNLYDEAEEMKGGLITFHGPGQLVIYPILNLKHFKPSIKWYVCRIEKTVINLCTKFGLVAETSPHTGVWIGDNKVCAIGIHGSRFITTHGFALNCNNDLTWFDHIVPCGLKLNRIVTIDEVLPKLLDSFSDVFECTFINYPKERADELWKNIDR
ncbi:hypothetical protein NQ317_006015 [Molorchus minor]|uniref:Octanoyl-[acyl-carrier-protein]:protein N-octanoyltransferase LIPT2, mitochondrial n=1 Tax=Molorchus minor TaxID=1323400 RepID=A0ABQ9J2V5_9CUCU|nr:hypothetical protein NQ317_006015 [Molorchus minor]